MSITGYSPDWVQSQDFLMSRFWSGTRLQSGLSLDIIQISFLKVKFWENWKLNSKNSKKSKIRKIWKHFEIGEKIMKIKKFEKMKHFINLQFFDFSNFRFQFIQILDFCFEFLDYLEFSISIFCFVKLLFQNWNLYFVQTKSRPESGFDLVQTKSRFQSG